MSHTIITLRYEQLLEEFETDKAWCFIFPGDGHKTFLPKSQVEDIRETANEVDLPLWLVEANGLEDHLI